MKDMSRKLWIRISKVKYTERNLWIEIELDGVTKIGSNKENCSTKPTDEKSKMTKQDFNQEIGITK